MTRPRNDADRVPSLDLIRGIAILLVVLVHSSQMVGFPGILANATSLGRYGVPLFFILSGFLIGSLHGLGKDWSLRNFISRRAARLLPAWWSFLALWILAFIIFPEQPFALADLSSEAKYTWIAVGVLLSILLLNDLTPITTNLFVPGGWSISAEAMHYALFPKLRLLSNRQLSVIAFVSGGVSVGLWIWISWTKSGWTPLNAWLTTWSPWSTLPLFLVGLLLARIIPSQMSAQLRSLLLALSAISLVSSGWLAAMVGVDFLPLVALTGVSLFVALYYSVRVPKWILLLGALSYEMYFTHFVVLAALERTPFLGWFQYEWAGIPFFVLVVVLSAASAYIVRWSISKPGGRLIRHLSILRKVV